jgi:protein-disulfide isomerase
MNNETKILGGIIVFTIVLFVLGVFFIGSKEETKSQLLTELDQVEGTNVKGNKEGADIVIEFADFQCPACAGFARVLSQFVEENKESVKFVMKHFPLASIHKNAMNSSYAAEAASKQGKFWEMHDMLYARQTEWSEIDNAEEVFKDYAKELELDVEKFGNDFLSKEVRDAVRADLTLALNLGLDSTPTIFINGKKYVGPATVADLNSALEKSR